MGIGYDEFISTREKRHHEAVGALWQRMIDRGLLYKDIYEGWYCATDDRYLAEWQVEKTATKGMVSKESGMIVEWIKEDVFKYRIPQWSIDKLNSWLDTRPIVGADSGAVTLDTKDFVVAGPSTLATGGVEVPSDEKYTVNSSFESLAVYLTSDLYPRSLPTRNMSYWKEATHLVTRDKLQVHAVQWPAILAGAGFPLPHRIIVTPPESHNQSVNPSAPISKFGVNGLRYILLRLNSHDIEEWSDTLAQRVIASDMILTYNNLIQTALSKSLHPTDQWPLLIPDDQLATLDSVSKSMIDRIKGLSDIVTVHYDKADTKSGIEDIIEFLQVTTGYMNDQLALVNAMEESTLKNGHRNNVMHIVTYGYNYHDPEATPNIPSVPLPKWQ
eukprot:gene10752-12521_t